MSRPLILSLIVLMLTSLPVQAADETPKKAGLVIRIEFDEEAVELGESVSGKAILKNTSTTNTIEVFFPGLNQHVYLSRIGRARAGKFADGTPMFHCAHKSQNVETSCEMQLVELPGFEGVEELEIEESMEDVLGIDVDMIEEKHSSKRRSNGANIVKLSPGEEATFRFSVADCRDILPKLAVPSFKDYVDPSFLPGTYALSVEYRSSGGIYWDGVIHSQPQKLKILPAQMKTKK